MSVHCKCTVSDLKRAIQAHGKVHTDNKAVKNSVLEHLLSPIWLVDTFAMIKRILFTFEPRSKVNKKLED